MTTPEFARRPEGFPGQRLVVLPAPIVNQAARQPVTRDLCVTHIGHFSAAAGHYVERPRGTREHILIACLAGAGHCHLHQNHHRLQPGQLLFLPPRESHIYHADPSSPWTIFWVHFRGERTSAYLDALGVNAQRPVLTLHDPSMLPEVFEDTFRHVTHGFGDAALLALSTSFARLLGLVKIHLQPAGARSRQAGSRLLRVLAAMRDDLARPWTLGELARAAGLSVPHFSELCRQQCGMPAISLLTRLRLQHAMDLLQRGRHNVAEAAAAVGYDDPFYFSRLFKKHMGMPPSACRRGP